VEVDRAIKDLGASLDVRLAKSKQDYMVNFTEEIKGKHQVYRDKKDHYDELIDPGKVQKDFDSKIALRQKMRKECDSQTVQHKKTFDAYLKAKAKSEEIQEEVEFLEEQVNQA
jgi:hypothetical protein